MPPTSQVHACYIEQDGSRPGTAAQRRQRTRLMYPGRSVLSTLHSRTPSLRAARNAWSDAVGSATPVSSSTQSAATRLREATCAARFCAEPAASPDRLSSCSCDASGASLASWPSLARKREGLGCSCSAGVRGRRS